MEKGPTGFVAAGAERFKLGQTGTEITETQASAFAFRFRSGRKTRVVVGSTVGLFL